MSASQVMNETSMWFIVKSQPWPTVGNRFVSLCLVTNAHNILWHVEPLLGNDSVNTFPRQRIRRQQSDNFRFYATVQWIQQRKRCFLWIRLETNKSYRTESNENESSAVKEDGFGWRLIVSYCNWLWLRVIVQEGVNKSNPNPISSHGAINTYSWLLQKA
jgi:hypothetical protein